MCVHILIPLLTSFMILDSWVEPRKSLLTTSGKEPACQCRRHKRHQFNPWVGKIPWNKKRQPTPVFLPGKSHVWRSLAGYSPWGHQESDMTEQLSTSHSGLGLPWWLRQ